MSQAALGIRCKWLHAEMRQLARPSFATDFVQLSDVTSVFLGCDNLYNTTRSRNARSDISSAAAVLLKRNKWSMNSGRICSCRCARQCRDLVGVVSQSFLNQFARKSRIVDTNTHQTAKVSQGSQT